ncbi:polymeric immunoglobulin receptor-like [Pygocentrus nattereri]|uniref:Ig-like domain-containing protein n=1 Tax=Pygocentrus nattereri TaxID=42514 RepID=A0A3B4CNV7_PYGNA|nr:polymeric immunoglobulin receptor-like [Pygocentrus nattereri]
MSSLLGILVLFQVLTYVTMTDKTKDIYIGAEGSTVEIYCYYPEGYQDYIKYFCRDPCTYNDVLTQSDSSDTVISGGRFTVQDKVSELSFVIIIRNLQREDSGVYYCGVEKRGYDIMSKVKVFVSGDESLPYVAMDDKSEYAYIGAEGSTVEIYCYYPEGYQDYIKYFCRDPCTYDDILIKSEISETVISEGRYTLLDKVSELNFVVSMTNLMVEDSGVYQCGVERSGYDILNKVELAISRAPLFSICTSTPASTTQSSSKQTHSTSGTIATSTVTETSSVFCLRV